MQYQRIIELRDGRACCLRSAVESDGQADLSCRFCGSHQLFDRKELEESKACHIAEKPEEIFLFAMEEED